MSKHIVKGYIYHEQDPAHRGYEWCSPKIGFTEYEPSPDIWEHRTVVGEHSFEVDVPDDFDPVPGLVAGLEEKRRLLRLKLANDLLLIDEQISKLTCIEHTPEAV